MDEAEGAGLRAELGKQLEHSQGQVRKVLGEVVAFSPEWVLCCSALLLLVASFLRPARVVAARSTSPHVTCTLHGGVCGLPVRQRRTDMVKRQSSSGRDRETEALLRSVAHAVKPFKAGTLAKVPLAHLMVYLEQHQLSGSLWIYDDKQDSTLQFVSGAPAKVKTTLRVPYLGELLVELGYIDQRSYDETITFALRGGGLHGVMLVACGLLDSAGLEAGLREQTALRLVEIFRHVGLASRFAFYRNVDLLASWGGIELTPIDPRWILWWGTCEREVDATVQVALDLLGDELLMLRPDADWSRFGFDDAEHDLLAWWSGRSATVNTLLSYRDLPTARIANLIFVLFLTRNLAYDEPVPTRVRSAPPPVPRPPTESVTQLLPRMPEGGSWHQAEPEPQGSLPDVTLQTGMPSFSGLRGPMESEVDIPIIVDEGESTEHGETPSAPAFASPPSVDMITATEHVPATQATARMAQAFQTLLDHMELQGNDEPPPPRGPTFSELDLARSAEAMQWSSRAGEALRNGEIEVAEQHAARALELLPDNAVLKTEYAWAASLLPSRRKIGDMGDLLDLLKAATESDPALDRPYYVRGTIFEYLGMYAKAYAEFRAAFARNAHNADAAGKIQEYVGRLEKTGAIEPEGMKAVASGAIGGVEIPAKAASMLAKLWNRG